MLITIQHCGHTEAGEQFILQWGTQSYAPVTLRGPEAAAVEGYDKLNLREGLVWYLEKYFDRPFGPNTKKAEAVEKALHLWGEQTLETLFSGKALRCLDAAQEDLKALQVRVISDSPAVLSWPWEALRDERGNFLFLHSSMERQPGNIQVTGSLTPGDAERLNILLVISRPREGDINYHFLSRDLVELVSEGDRPIQVDVLRPPTFDNLRRTLEERPGYYHIVHFDGHGGYDSEAAGGAEGCLFFEKDVDGRVEPDPVSAETLGQLFGTCRVPMMVLNACQSAMIDERAGDVYSSVAASLLRARVRSVVAMGYSLFTGGAKAFINAFYGELLRSGSTELAMREGRIAMFLHKDKYYPLSDWIVPQLFQQAQQGERVLPDLTDKIRPATPSRLPPEARLEKEGFIGRGRAVQELERLSRRGRQAGILIYGMMGQGKTTLAQGFLRWLEQTGGLGEAGDENPALWLDFRGIHSAEAVVNTMARAFLEEDTSLPGGRERLERLAAYMKRHRKIVVWDNFESASGMKGVTEPQLSQEELGILAELLTKLRGGASKIIITSRNAEETFGRPICSRLSRPLGGLEGSEFWALCVSLAEEQGVTVSREDEALSELLDRLDGNPLVARALLLRLGEGVGTLQLLADFETAFVGAAGDESTRRVRASFQLLCDSIQPEDEAVLRGLGLFEQYVDLDFLWNMLLNLKGRERTDQEEEEQAAIIGRCVYRLCQAGFCQRMSEGVYKLHPSLRGCLTERFPPEEALRRMFVQVLRDAERREHNNWQTRMGFAALHEANCHRARAIALEADMREEYLDLTFDLSVFAGNRGDFSEEERLLLEEAKEAERWDAKVRLKQAFSTLSSLFALAGDSQRAKQFGEKAVDAQEGCAQTAEDYLDLAMQAYREGNYNPAVEYFEKVALLWGNSCEERQLSLYGALFSIYRLKDDDNGTAKWRKMLEDGVDACSDESVKAGIYSILANYAVETEDYERAVKYHQRSYEVYQRLCAPFEEAREGNIFGHLLLMLRLPDQAKPYLDRALELSTNLKHKPEVAYSYYNLSLWAALDKRESRQYAIDLAKEALKLYRELNNEFMITETQTLLDDIQAGKYD